MRDIDENMDELFRKAADNYMLKEGESNWAEISAQIEPAMSPVQVVKKNNTKRYLLVAMLMLMFFIAGDLFHNYTSKRETANSVIQNNRAAERLTDDDKTSSVKEENSINTIKKNNSINDEIPAVTNSKSKNDNEYAQKKTNTFVSNNGNINPHSNNKPNIFKQPAQLLTKNTIPDNVPYPFIKSQDNFRGYIKDSDLTAQASIDKKTSIELLTKDPATTINPVLKIKVKKQSGFYAGLLAGATFNSVKQQDISKPGLDIGLIAGYKINSRLSVETGILYSRKNYYTDGKYFNMEKVGNSMPAGMEVLSLKGKSNVLEFPAKLKYNFIQKNNKAIYGAAGFSSYLLTNEKNDYTTLLNNTTGNIKTTYRKNTGYFAGAINLSAGYEYKLGAKSSVRFEPYIEIPIKGIGVGKLPVASSGVHVLFTLSH